MNVSAGCGLLANFNTDAVVLGINAYLKTNKQNKQKSTPKQTFPLTQIKSKTPVNPEEESLVEIPEINCFQPARHNVDGTLKNLKPV